MTLLGRVRRTVFGISFEEARVERRGFHSSGVLVSTRLERIGTEFLSGYHAALEEASCGVLGLRLNETVAAEYRGFAFEGAAMALSLLDYLRFRRRCFREFLAGPGEPHTYMLHVGVGWAIARLPWVRRRLDGALNSLDPLLRWLAVDGYGFHEGYFHSNQAIRQQAIPRAVTGYTQHAFDQGLGRSLWLVEGMDPERVSTTIAAFPGFRQADLWAGAGLASAYAGGSDWASLSRLRELSGYQAPACAQGAAFAAEARRRAGNPVEHCDLACQSICGMSAEQAAAIARNEMRQLPPDGVIPAYEIWRRRVQQRLVKAHDRIPV